LLDKTTRRVSAMLDLVRWPNMLLAAGGVAAGAAWAAGGLPRAPATILACIAGAALAALAYAWNDYGDQAIDAVAHPTRPIPRGALSSRDAVGVAIASAAVALVASAAARPAMAGATVLVILLTLTYGRLKAISGIAANAVVAVIASLPFVYGAWAVGRPTLGVPLFIIAVPLHLARELAKDVDDAAADAAGHRRTLPIALGQRAVRSIIVGATIAALVPFALVVFRAHSLAAAAAAPGLLICAYAARRAVLGRSESARWYKWGMAAAVIALLATAGVGA